MKDLARGKNKFDKSKREKCLQTRGFKNIRKINGYIEYDKTMFSDTEDKVLYENQ